MQKSVLIPFEKYERLTGKNRERKEASTQTESVKDEIDSVKSQHSESQSLSGTGAPLKGELSRSLSLSAKESKDIESKQAKLNDKSSTLSAKSNLSANARRQHSSSPPGKRHFKSLWLKLDGKL